MNVDTEVARLMREEGFTRNEAAAIVGSMAATALSATQNDQEPAPRTEVTPERQNGSEPVRCQCRSGCLTTDHCRSLGRCIDAPVHHDVLVAQRDRARATAVDLEQRLARVVERLTDIAGRAEKTPHKNDPFFVALEIADELRDVLREVTA